MYNQKTRCRQCEFADVRASKYPCSKCSEIMLKTQYMVNYFQDKSEKQALEPEDE